MPGCSPAFWQQRSRAGFIKALNSTHETFPGSPTRSFTRARTRSFFPNLNENGSSSLHGGGGEISNTPIQEVCPLDLNEHLAVGTFDSVA
jgi:hypothetical protein